MRTPKIEQFFLLDNFCVDDAFYHKLSMTTDGLPTPFSKRLPFVSEFLGRTYPKTNQYPDVNRIVGQPEIESRQGCHSNDDFVALSLISNAAK